MKNIILLKSKILSLFLNSLFIILILLISISILTHFAADAMVTKGTPNSFKGIKGIEDKNKVIVWFVDGGALSSRFDNAILYDYTWNVSFEGNPCTFLKKNKVNYIVYFHFYIEEGYSKYLGDFRSILRDSLVNEECSELVSKNGLEIFKINHNK